MPTHLELAPLSPALRAVRLRSACDEDASGLIRLIGSIYAEYERCFLDVDGEAPELRAVASHYQAAGGAFWVAEWDGEIVASVGWVPASDPDGVELRKLYVARAARRGGLAGALCARVEQAARVRAARGVELWSDTKFQDAHRFYAQRGYRLSGAERDLLDCSDTREFHFQLDLDHVPA